MVTNRDIKLSVTAEVRSRKLGWKLEMGSRKSEDPLAL